MQGAIPISFEFFPPKTLNGQDNLLNAAALLAKESPHFFSMTYGAGGSTRQGTIQMVEMIRDMTSISVAPHLSCIGSSRQELIEMIQLYRGMNFNRMVALRGDLPSGMGQVSAKLSHGSDLVALIREVSGDYFHIEVAAYPECHPQAKSFQHDLFYFCEKVHAGANSAITQYFYNPDAYFYFIEDCAKLDIHIPIVPGIMPITNYHKLNLFSDRCGAEIPQWLKKKLIGYGDDLESIQAYGLEVVYKLCQKLVAGGAPGLHFYTLNQAEPTLSVLRMLEIEGYKKELSICYQKGY